MSDRKKREKLVFRNTILLFLTAIIWGTSFVAQSAGMEYIGPFTFSVIRYVLGGTVLIPVIIFLRKKQEKPADLMLSIKYGLGCGIILCAASNFQQMAMLKASAGKAGFITALYIILVPILGIFMRKKTSPVIWLSVLLAVIGLYFLCIGRSGNYRFEMSDLELLICSLLFSFHIVYVDYANSKGVDGVVMSSTQFFTAAVVSAFFVVPVDVCIYDMIPRVELIKAALPALCYSGFMACGVAYTLQIVGQNEVNPTVASLIMSLESVVSAISGFVILHQELTVDETMGCLIMFAAIILAEMPSSAKYTRRKRTAHKKELKERLE
ncbi:MAG: DMT family transporter [Eubacterium sp.]|nr:DMT family transporter [Eubacterium sp.]